MKELIELFDDFAKSIPLMIYFEPKLTFIRFLIFSVIYLMLSNLIFWCNNI